MEIERIVNSERFFYSNTYILKDGSECLVVDPVDVPAIVERTRGLDVVGVLITHGHFDHCFGAKGLQEMGYKIYMSPLDASEGMLAFARECVEEFEAFDIDVPVCDGEYQIGGFCVRVLNTAGHSKGAVTYIIDGVMFTGDTIFRDAIGRYDFVGGNHSELIQSLRALFALEDMPMYGGHGEPTTLQRERDRRRNKKRD